MDFKIRINKIFQAFYLPLPGKQAHRELAPYRNEIELDFKNKNPEDLVVVLRGLKDYKHRMFFYGKNIEEKIIVFTRSIFAAMRL